MLKAHDEHYKSCIRLVIKWSFCRGEDAVTGENLVACSEFFCVIITWLRTLNIKCIWSGSLGSTCLTSLSVNINTCPFEGNLMTWLLSSVMVVALLSMCWYLDHVHGGIIWMTLMSREPVNLSLQVCMATDAKCAQIALHVHKLITSTSMSVLGFPQNYLESKYSGKHNHMSKEVYLLFPNA